MATSSSSEVSLPTLPIFKGEGYERWSVKMKTLFRSLKLWKVVEDGVLTTGTETQQEESQQADARAMYIIQQSVDDAIFDRIQDLATAKEAWELIQKLYHGPSRVVSIRKQTLRQRFEVLQMKESEDIQEYIKRVITIVNQSKSLGYQISNEDVVSKILRSLTPRYDMCVTAIEEARDIAEMSLEELTGSLQAHEARLSRFMDKPEEKAFNVKGEASSSREHDRGAARGRGRDYSRGRGRGRGRFRGRGRGFVPRHPSGEDHGVQKSFKNNVQCYHCKRYGHTKANCWFKDKIFDKGTGMSLCAENSSEQEFGNLFMAHTESEELESSI